MEMDQSSKIYETHEPNQTWLIAVSVENMAALGAGGPFNASHELAAWYK